MKFNRRLVSLLTAVGVCGLLVACVEVEQPASANLSVDIAADAATPGWASLPDLIVKEVSPTAGMEGTDGFGSGGTVILQAPAGFEFNTGAVLNATWAVGDLTNVTAQVSSADQLTIDLSFATTNFYDSFTVSGVQARPISGTTLDVGNIVRNGGTAVFNTQNTLVFGTLREVGGAPVTMQVQTQPPSTATAGEVFNPQPVIELRDQFGNVSDQDTSVVTVTPSTGTLVGTTSINAVAGVASFTDLARELAGPVTLNFSGPNSTQASSQEIIVTAAPASALDFAISPAEARAFSPFGVQPVVVTRDAFGNLSTNGLAPSQIVELSLNSGSGTLLGTTTADIGTDAGNGSVTFTNLQIDIGGLNKQLVASNETLSAALSAPFLVGGVEPADAFVSIDTSVSGSVELTGPSYYELHPGDIGAGTIVLTAPAGFEFITTGQAPRVQIHRSSGSKNGSLNGVESGSPIDLAVTPTQITYTITQPSSGNTVNYLVFSKIRVRATGTGALSGDITHTGTSVLASVVNGVTSWGHLETSAGAFAQMVIQTQPSATANAGVLFAQQPVIQLQDQFGNPVTNDNSTVVTAIANGSDSLQGTTSVTATNGLVTFTDLSYNAVETITITFTNATAGVISEQIVVGAGPVAGLVFTTEPANAVVGVPFAVSPVVQTVDQFGNPTTFELGENLEVTIELTAGSGPLTGTTNLNIGTLGGNGTITLSDLQVGSASEVNQLTASASGISSAVSAVFTSVAADHLEYVDGDGQTAVAGSAVAINPTVRVVDDLNNPIAGAFVTFTVQNGGGSVSDSSVITDTNGLASTTFTLGGVLGDSNQVLTASANVPGTPSSITFYATATVGTAAKLGIATQPSSTATAGEVFAQQPAIRIEDSFGNLIADDNTTVVSVAVNTGTGTLNGTLTATATNGIATFTDLSYNVAEVIDLVFSASALTNVISETITVSPATITGLAFTTQPGGAYTDENLNPQPVVSSVDAFGNVSTNGLPESLLVSLVLTNSTGELVGTTTLDIGTAGSVGVATFTNLQVTTGGFKQLIATATNLTDALSEQFTVGGIDPGTTAIIPANGSSVPMTGPAYYELNSGDVNVGTITLDAPVGFEFDPAFTPVVRVQRIGGAGSPANNINGASNGANGTTYPVSITPTQITFTVTSASTNGVSNSLTWENIYVRYATGAVPPSGEVTKSGTSVMTTVQDGVTSFATLNGEPRPSKVFIVTQPSSTATAGVPFAQQPVVRVEDQYGNIWTNGSFTVTAVRAAGSGDLQGTVSVQTVNGIATFTDLSHNVAGTITITFTGENLAPATSGNIVVSPAAADHLHFTTQPGSAVVGTPFGVQPVVQSVDQFHNVSTVGLGASHIVTIALNSGTGSLIGTTTADIGTAAGNGTATFTNIGATTVGEKQLIATAPNLLSDLSATFTVAADGGSGKLDQTITFDPLTNKVFGDAPFTLSATASSGLPVTFSIVDGPATISGNTITLTGVGTVIVRASQGGNEAYNAAPSVERSFEVAPSGKLVKGDINGDDRADVLFQDGQVIGIWYMDGTNFLSAALLRDGIRDAATWKICGQADFTGDGNQDLLFQSLDGRLAIWEMNGSVKVSAQLLNGGSQVGGRVVAVADMDNDQTPDVIIQRVNESADVNGAVSILFLDGLNFRSGVQVRGTEALNWRVRAAGDLDGDTFADIIAQHTDGRLEMWSGADEYITAVELNNNVPVASRLVGFGDFNGDEQLDLLFRTPLNRLSIWLMDGVNRTSATFLREGKSVDPKWSVVGPR